MSNQDVIIIGSGLGGLICGAILAREGYRVEVLEKGTRYGGGLQMFSRSGTRFETGFHYVGGLNRGATVHRLFDYLGIMDKIELKMLDSDCFDELILDGKSYRLAMGRNNFVDSLSEYFPEQRDDIKRYVDAIYALCDRIPLYNLKMPTVDGLASDEEAELSIGELIDSHTQNLTLREVLAWNNTLYAGERYKTQAYVGAMISKLYIEGAARFCKGSDQVAEALKWVIERGGGKVTCNSEVKKIEVENRHVTGLLTADGERHVGTHYISSIHPLKLMELCSDGTFPKPFCNRIRHLHNSYSLFSVFVRFKPNSFKFLNRNIYLQTTGNGVWNMEEYTADDFPRGLMIMTPPDDKEQQWAQRMIIHSVMRWQSVERWENTLSGHRGAEYEEFKTECQTRILNEIERLFPSFIESVEEVFSATPLTLRDCMSLPEGAVYGTVHDCHRLYESYLSTRTKVDNLYLTGQNIRLHGMCGVPVTAIETCANITGMRELIEKIDKY